MYIYLALLSSCLTHKTAALAVYSAYSDQQPRYVTNRSGIDDVRRALENESGSLYPKTEYAIPTDNDLVADHSRIHYHNSFSEQYNYSHFDGTIEIETEDGRRHVPFALVNMVNYANGFDVPQLRDPMSLLKEMEAERRLKMLAYNSADAEFQSCQAIVARAFGFPQRMEWLGWR